MDIERIIQLAVYAGKIMLENGAETYRVEDTVTRICDAYNVSNADCFVTPTGIMTSITNDYGRTISIVKRIHSRTTNLEKISQVNDLSRNILSKGHTLEYVENALKDIDSTPMYSHRVLTLFSCIGAAFFTLMFGGNMQDFAVSFFIGGMIHLSLYWLDKFHSNGFFSNVVGGALVALIALVSVDLGLAPDLDKIIIGSIMLLVPGLSITNAIRDTISGDLLAGVARAVEAFLVAVAIAIGTGSMLKFWFFIKGGMQ